MEELTSILGIVVAAGVLVAKAALRKKATDAAKGSRTADPHGEAWPPIPPFATIRPAMTRDEETEPAPDTAFGPIARKIAAARKSIQAAEEMPAAARSDAELQNGSADHTQAVRDSRSSDVSDYGSAAQTQAIPEHGPAVVSAASRPTATTSRLSVAAQENRRKKAENPASDFDLRKAVIASEILRPKFDE